MAFLAFQVKGASLETLGSGVCDYERRISERFGYDVVLTKAGRGSLIMVK